MRHEVFRYSLLLARPPPPLTHPVRPFPPAAPLTPSRLSLHKHITYACGRFLHCKPLVVYPFPLDINTPLHESPLQSQFLPIVLTSHIVVYFYFFGPPCKSVLSTDAFRPRDIFSLV